MKKTVLTSLALVGTLLTANAQANDTMVGAVIGGGMGGLIGHSVNGQNGAVVGALVGAMAGAALASNSGPRYAGTAYGAPSYHARPPAYYRHPAVAMPVHYHGRPDRHYSRYERRHHDHHRHWH